MSNSVSFETPETGSEAPAQDLQNTGDPNRPEWLPEQFKSPEDFAKSWQDQRAEITRLQQASAQNKQPDPPDSGEPPKDEQEKPPAADDKQNQQDDAAKELADQAGLDLSPYQEEYSSTGDVSEENREAIAKSLEKQLGPNARQIVDEFIEARKVVHENDTRMFMDAAGGQESYTQMVNWASTALPPEQVQAYNKQVNSGDRHTVLFAIEGLRAKYEQANGRDPRLISGSGRPGAAVGGFSSTAEMTRAMSDPRYKSDPAYREEVRAKLARSNF